MPLFVIPFPAIDPVAVSIGPFAIRWYALAYIVGLLIGWRYCLGLAGRTPHLVARQDVDEQGNTGAAIGSSLATGLDAGSVSTLLLHAP